MAILNLEYYTQKDLYSDGDIEEQMLKMAKEGVTCEELSSEQVSFPVILRSASKYTELVSDQKIGQCSGDRCGLWCNHRYAL